MDDIITLDSGVDTLLVDSTVRSSDLVEDPVGSSKSPGLLDEYLMVRVDSSETLEIRLVVLALSDVDRVAVVNVDETAEIPIKGEMDGLVKL